MANVLTAAARRSYLLPRRFGNSSHGKVLCHSFSSSVSQLSIKTLSKRKMPKVDVVDESGFTLKLLQLEDGRFAGENFNADTLNNSKSIKMSEGEVIFCSYAKSGCHWVWQNVRHLLQGEVILDSVDKESSMIEVLTIDEIDNLPCPRILNTHVFFDMLPEDVLKGGVKVVLVYRNPKDIAVSFFHHHSRLKHYSYQGEFSHYLKRFAEGLVSNNNVFDYWHSWEEGLSANPQIPYHLVSFEDLKLNPLSTRRKLAEFLGRSDCSDDFLHQVDQATSIDVMRTLKGDIKDNKGEPVMYRKGVIGDWKNHFTVEESQWFDKIIQERMANSKLFEFIYSNDDSS